MATQESKTASSSITSEEKYRTGKWTREEEAYAQGLIEQFQAGFIALPDGSSLRQFLAKMLTCRAKRISKKFEGNNYAHGRKFYVKSNDRLSAEEAQRRSKRLCELERRFKSSITTSNKPKKLQVEEQNQERESLLSCSLFDEYLLSGEGGNHNRLSGGKEAATTTSAAAAPAMSQYASILGSQQGGGDFAPSNHNSAASTFPTQYRLEELLTTSQLRTSGAFSNMATPISQPLAQPYRQQDPNYQQLLARLNNDEEHQNNNISTTQTTTDLGGLAGGRGMSTNSIGNQTSSDARNLRNLQMLLLHQQSLRDSSSNSHGPDTSQQQGGSDDPLALLGRVAGLSSRSQDQNHLQQLQFLMRLKNNQAQDGSTTLQQNLPSNTLQSPTSLVLEQLMAEVHQQQRNQSADSEPPILRLLEARRLLQLTPGMGAAAALPQLDTTVPAASQHLHSLPQGQALENHDRSAFLDALRAQQQQLALGNYNATIRNALPAATLDFSRIDTSRTSTSSSNGAFMSAIEAQQLAALRRERQQQESSNGDEDVYYSNNNMTREDEKQTGSGDSNRKLPAKKRRFL